MSRFKTRIAMLDKMFPFSICITSQVLLDVNGRGRSMDPILNYKILNNYIP